MKKLILPVLAGCIVTGALSHETLTTTVLFDREIVRILNNHCVMCHVENGPSFALSTYEQTWLQKRQIRADVIARHMPPWAAVPGYGQFVNDNSLTLRETQFIVSWVEGLGPRNSGTVFTNIAGPDAARPKEVAAHTDFGRWQLGEPKLTRQLSANTIDTKQPDAIRRTVIDLGLTSERRLRGLEYMPGDRRVVRAAFFNVQETGQWIGSWTPWYGFVNLPKDAAWRLPAGSHVVAEIHYRSSKERVVDQGILGLFFADQPSPELVSDLVLEAKGEVPTGAPSQKFRAATRLTGDSCVLAMRLETQPGVKSVQVSARRPDGRTEVMLFAKDFSIEWPAPYIFRDPVALSKGTELSVTGYYANASAVPQPGGIRVTVSRYQRAGSRK
jgi:hypothetical protein